MRRQLVLFVLVVLFGGGLLLAWFTHGTGVVRNDHARSIHIPDRLTMPLQLKVSYNDEDIFFRYRWPTEEPYFYIDVFRYTDGEWVRHGRSPVGPEPDGVYEDRVTMLVDDGTEPNWERTDWHEITLFYPGQVSWPRLTSEIHAGAEYIRQGVPVKFRHTEPQLAQYGVEIEFENEIRSQWWLTLILGVLMIVSFALSFNLLYDRKEG